MRFEQDARERMQKTVQHVQETLQRIRSGRANPALLEDIRVEAYGTTMPLKHVASVFVGDPKTLVVKPFDKNILPQVEKAILKANLGLTPSREAEQIKLHLPPMTEETRRNVLKLTKQEVEEGKIALRNIRHDVLKQIRTARENKEITEDQFYRLRDRLDKLVEEFSRKLDDLYARKEKEILQA